MNFKATVLHETGTPLTVEDVKISGLKPGDVLVRVYASGLCHTDLEVIEGSLPYPLPITLGHEGAGVVESVGPGVERVAVGDHVVCSWNPNCGHCYYCDRDQPILCEPFSANQPLGRLPDGGGRLSLADGGALHHFSVVSSHAQYCVVPESGAIVVPEEIPFDRACLIGCGVMTGVGAALNVAQVQPGESVLVIGCGAVGLNAIQGAVLGGAEQILACDIEASKRSMGQVFGATEVFSPDEAAERTMAATGGRGADHVIEAAGIVQTLQPSLDLVRSGGNVVLLGKTNSNATLHVRWGSLMGEKRIVRSSYGNARPRRDFPMLARLYLAGRLNLDDLISRRLELDEINEGFDSMRIGDGVRSVVMMQH